MSVPLESTFSVRKSHFSSRFFVFADVIICKSKNFNWQKPRFIPYAYNSISCVNQVSPKTKIGSKKVTYCLFMCITKLNCINFHMYNKYLLNDTYSPTAIIYLKFSSSVLQKDSFFLKVFYKNVKFINIEIIIYCIN